MYIDSRDIRATARANPVGGPQTNLLENLRASFPETRWNRLGWFSEVLGLETAYEDYLDEIFAATGKRLTSPLAIWEGENPRTAGGVTSRLSRHADAFHAEALALSEETGLFDAMSADDITARIQERSGDLIQAREDVTSRASGAGVAGQFIGDMGAYLTEPLTAITSLYAPARAAGILRTSLEMAILTGGAEALLQTSAQRYREDLGLDHGFVQAATAVGFVGGTAGILSGVLKAGQLGLRNLLDLHNAVSITPSAMELEARRIVAAEINMAEAYGEGFRNIPKMDAADALARNGQAMTTPPPTRTAQAAAAPEPVIREAWRAKLPEHLDLGLVGAKPRYKQSELKFDSDVDLALYIVSEGGWATDANYRLWLRGTLGVSDKDITQLAKATRDQVKAAVKEGGKDGVVTIRAPKEKPAPRPRAPTAEPLTVVQSRTAAQNKGLGDAADAYEGIVKDVGGTIDEGTAEVLAMMRDPSKAPDPGQSLIQWLIAQGGVRDLGGHLTKLLQVPIKKGSKKSAGSLHPGLVSNKGVAEIERLTKKGDRRKTPLDIEDKAGNAAAEAGFFPELLARLKSGTVADDESRDILIEAIRAEIAGEKLYIVDEHSLRAQDMDMAMRAVDQKLHLADADLGMSDAEISARFKRYDEGMEEEWRAIVENEPDMIIPRGNEEEGFTNKTAREVQDEIDADQKLVDELNLCFTPGWDI